MIGMSVGYVFFEKPQFPAAGSHYFLHRLLSTVTLKSETNDGSARVLMDTGLVCGQEKK
jgi:hypothetical protein